MCHLDDPQWVALLFQVTDPPRPRGSSGCCPHTTLWAATLFLSASFITDEAKNHTSCSRIACRFKRARVATPTEQQLGDHEISSVSTSHRQAPPSRIIRISPDEWGTVRVWWLPSLTCMSDRIVSAAGVTYGRPRTPPGYPRFPQQ